MNYQVVCAGSITEDATGAAICSTGWVQQVATVPFHVTDIDPSVATAMFTGGFILVITPWAVAWGLSKLLAFLR